MAALRTYPVGREAPFLQGGDIRPLKRGLLLLDVLLNDAWRCPATTGGKVRRRPQGILPIAFLNIRPFYAKQPTGNAFEAVNQARHRVFRWVVDEQVYVLGFAVHFEQLCLEVGTNFFEDDFEPLDRVSVQHLCSILCDEDQVGMQCRDANVGRDEYRSTVA